MKKRLFSLKVLALLFCCGALLMLHAGCAGGGGGGAASATPETAQPAQINGKVSISGVSDYSGVVVVAEKSADGVTASVRAMMKQAGKGERISARQAQAADGVYTATTGADGAFSLTVPEGDYTISAFKQDSVAAQPQKITARAAAAVTVNFELIATGKVAGSFSLPASINANDYIMLAYLEGTSFAAYADSNGAFTISNVPIGTYNIVFAVGSTRKGTHTGIAVTAGATTSSASTVFATLCYANSDCPGNTTDSFPMCLNGFTESASCTTYRCNQNSDCPGNTTDSFPYCQNGGTTQASCTTYRCNDNSNCNDNNANTIDLCNNGGTLTAACNNYPRTTVLSYSPSNGATNVSRTNPQFRVVFSRSMSTSAYSSGSGLNFTISPSIAGISNIRHEGQGYGGSYSWQSTNTTNDTLVYTPKTFYGFCCVYLLPLSANTTYQISIVGNTGTNSLRDIYNFEPDLSGLPTSGSFTTGP